MSDSSDEDFTSDKFLTSSKRDDIRPGLLHSKVQQRQHYMYKKQQEARTKRPMSYHQQEKHVREKGLNTAISPSNKGFKMLERMGYKAGTSLGKSDSGIKEPVAIATKSDASGVGREAHIKDVVIKKRKLAEESYKFHEKVYKESKTEKNILSMLRRDYYKARQVCENLDFQNDVKSSDPTLYWTAATVKSLKEKEKAKNDHSEDESEEESENSEDDTEEIISEENLFTVIHYLREKYLYCLYCAFRASDNADLQANCPGPYRTNHDDLDE